MTQRRIVVATAGHVDHGKTALIRALTGTDTDRLPEEKRRGISIELGFAELDDHVSIIDVPGHRKLVHAMIAGVGGVDALLLAVAVDDGVMPQTREHLHVARLLGIDRVIVALTKADLVDADTIALAKEEVAQLLDSLGFVREAEVVTSVQTGQGIDELRGVLSALPPKKDARRSSERLWLPIDRVFSIQGSGTVITGTLTRGALRAGEVVYLTGDKGSEQAVCRSLEVHGHAVETADAPTRLAVNLTRVDMHSVHRGDVVTRDPELPHPRRIDVSLTILPGADAELADRAPVTVYIGTARTQARIVHYGDGLAHLSLESPIACEGDVGYVIRGFSSNRERGAVLGGGRVLDASAPPLPKRKAKASWSRRSKLLAAARDRDLIQLLVHLLEAAELRPLDADDIERRFGLEPRTVRRTLESNKSIETTALAEGRLWISSAATASLIDRIVDSVARHHRLSPDEPGVSLETLRTELRAVTGRDAAEHAVTHALESNRLQTAGQGLVCLPSFAESSRGSVERTTDGVSAALMKVSLEGALDSDLVQLAGGNIASVRAALARLAAAGRARRLGTLWFAEDKLNELRSAVRAHLSEHGSMTVAAFKDIANVSRKQAIPLLEQFDREGTTRRVGDTRVLGGKAQTP